MRNYKEYFDRKTELLGSGWREHPSGCVPSALALITGRTFEDAVEYATEKLGYDRKTGVNSLRLYNLLDSSTRWKRIKIEDFCNEYKVEGHIVMRRPRAKSLAKKFSRGKYLLMTSGHATAIVEGELIESNPKRIVNAVYEYVG